MQPPLNTTGRSQNHARVTRPCRGISYNLSDREFPACQVRAAAWASTGSTFSASPMDHAAHTASHPATSQTLCHSGQCHSLPHPYAHGNSLSSCTTRSTPPSPDAITSCSMPASVPNRGSGSITEAQPCLLRGTSVPAPHRAPTPLPSGALRNVRSKRSGGSTQHGSLLPPAARLSGAGLRLLVRVKVPAVRHV